MTSLTVYCQPGAKRSRVAGLHDGKIKIQLAAPPRDGEANDELIRFVSAILGLPKSAVSLVAGQTSRIKRLEIDSLDDADRLLERLLTLTGAKF